MIFLHQKPLIEQLCTLLPLDTMRQFWRVSPAILRACARERALRVRHKAHYFLKDWTGIKTSFHDAVRFASLDVVVFLCENSRSLVKEWDGEYEHNRLVDIAAECGHLDILKWLHVNWPHARCTTNAMSFAAQNGHLCVIKWLHYNRTEGCTMYAMDSAAGEGHFDVVQWLHANRTEGCTSKAMDWAAAHGHLDLVIWLHENRSEGCTALAMDSAAELGHLSTVQWLHANRVEGCSDRAVARAAKNGHLDVVKWLFSNYRAVCNPRQILAVARNSDRRKIVQWVVNDIL